MVGHERHETPNIVITSELAKGIRLDVVAIG